MQFLQTSKRNTELQFRVARESDLPRILELMSISLGTGSIPRTESYWKWKHRRTPFGESPVLLAETEGQLTGLRVFMRWNWLHGDRRIQAVRAVDTATHPDWQGRGIFTRLTLALAGQMEEEGVSFIFNTPNRSSRPGYLKMGWSSLGRPPLWIRPARILKLGRLLEVAREESGGLGPIRNLDLSQTTPLMLREDYGLRHHLDQEALDVALKARLQPADTLRTEITREYLRWRYLENPGVEYRAAGVWEEGRQAMIIFRGCERRGLIELRLCEILVGSGKGSVAAASRPINRVVSTVSPDFVTAMAGSGTAERRVLLRSRFLRIPQGGPTVTLRPLGWHSALRELGKWSHWRLTIGDLELF